MRDYWALRDHLASDIRYGLVRPNPAALIERVAACAGGGKNHASETVERFYRDLKREIAQRKTG